MEPGDELSGYLRKRRERLKPEMVGLPQTSRRRVPGLRREEVARLAGISTEYYLRLEQGRDTRPSPSVVSALAAALRLDADETAYLRRLAEPPRAAVHASSRGVDPAVQQLIDQWETPALIQDPCLDTLAANRMAVALCPHFAPGGNSLRAAFLEPDMRSLYRDWEAVTARAVAYLRSLAGAGMKTNPSVRSFITELSGKSERFRMLWERGEVEYAISGPALFDHPLVGELDLHYEKFALPSAPGQLLVTYHAPMGTTSSDRLRQLSVLSGGGASPAHHYRQSDAAHEVQI